MSRLPVKKATAPQIAFLEARGIRPSSSRYGCSRIIGYIKDGNGIGKATSEDERIALLNLTRAELEGKKVFLDQGTEEVHEVVAVLPKTKEEVVSQARRQKMFKEDYKINPFVLYVRNCRGHVFLVTAGRARVCQDDM